MAVLGPRMRRGGSRAAAGVVAGRTPLLPSATRQPAAPWQVRDAFLVLGSGLAFLIAALIVTVSLAELQTANAQDLGPKTAISTLVAAGYYLFLLWMIWLLIVKRYRCGWRALGLRTVGWQWLAAVPFIYAVLTFSYLLELFGLRAILGPTTRWPAPLTSSSLEATQQPLLRALVIVTGVALAPLVEELLFRGVLFKALRRSMPLGGAALLSALIFALMHFNYLVFLPLTVMGVVLALVYERSGSIVPTVLVHACNNGILLYVHYFVHFSSATTS